MGASAIADVGARLRQARLAKGMTLRAVGAKIGLSAAFLSRLERGQVSSSIAHLIQISELYGTHVSTLFAGPEPGAERTHVVFRAGQAGAAQPIETTGYRYEPLIREWAGQMIDAFLLTFPVRNRTDVMTAHEGEEMLYLLRGRIVFRLGSEAIPLEAGDAIYFRSDIPHMGKNTGEADAQALIVTAPGRGSGRELGWWRLPAGPVRRLAARRRAITGRGRPATTSRR